MSDAANDPTRNAGAGDDPEPEEVRSRFTESVDAAKWGAGSDTYRLLREMLATAVPLWILRYQGRGGPEPSDFKRVAAYNDELGRADVLLFGGEHRPGEVATFFNHMAEAMAVLSFCQRGIELFGLRYESPPPRAPRQEEPGSKARPGGAP